MVKLSEREWMVLGVLWDTGGAALGAVTGALHEETGWSRNTVLTYLTRMEAKGLVSIDKGGGAEPGGLPGSGPGQLSPKCIPGLYRGPGGGLFERKAHIAPGAGGAAPPSG